MPQKPGHHGSLRTGPSTKHKKMAAGSSGLNVSLNGSFNLSSSLISSDFPWHDEKKSGGRKRIGSSKRRAPLSTADGGPPTGFATLMEIDGVDPDEELQQQLKDPLQEISRQRLRAIRINFRRLGGNVENRITGKELWSVFMEHNIKVSGRVFQLILNKYEDQFGVDYEKLWKFMVEAQKLTGRDSVQATNRLNNSFSHLHSSSLSEYDGEDMNMLVRLHRALQNSSEFELDDLRAVFKERDKGRSGQLEKKQMKKICEEFHLPVHGGLLNSLLNRCDDEKNGQISWPEFMTFLERAEMIMLDPATGKPEMIHAPVRPISGRLRPKSSRIRGTEIKEEVAVNPSTTNAATTSSSGNAGGNATPTANRKSRFDFTIGSEGTGSLADKEKVESPREKKAHATSLDKKALDSPREKTVQETKKEITSTAPRKETESKEKKVTDSKIPESPREKESDRTEEKKSGTAVNRKQGIAIAVPVETMHSDEGMKIIDKTSAAEKTVVKESPPINVPVVAAANTPVSNMDTKIKTESSMKLTTAAEIHTADDMVEPIVVPAHSVDANKKSEASGLIDATPKIDAPVKDKNVKSESKIDNENTKKNESENVNNKNGRDSPRDDISVKTSSRQSSAKRSSQTKKETDVGTNKPSNKLDKKPTAKGKPRPFTGTSIQSNKSQKKNGSVANLSKDDKNKKGGGNRTPKNSTSTNAASTEHSKGKVHGANSGETMSVSTTYSIQTSDSHTVNENNLNKNTKVDNKVENTGMKKNISSSSLASSTSMPDGAINSNNSAYEHDLGSSHSSELLKPLLVPDVNENSQSDAKDGSESLLFKKSAGSVKNTGGFLNSVKNLFGGNKNKEANQEMIPIVTVNSPEPSSESDQGKPKAPPPPGGAINEVSVRGRDMKYYVPDVYYSKNISPYSPKEKLELDWIYGYRGNDCRCNIYVLSSGEVVYFVATFVVIYNVQTRKQRYYKEHTADIRSIAIHPNKVTLATGQSAQDKVDAHIRIWQSDTLQTIQILGVGLIQNAVMCLAFSQFQDRLVSTDNSESHTMFVWDINVGKQITQTSVYTDAICQVAFHPKNPNVLVTVGKEHQVWWEIKTENGKTAIEEMMKADFEDKWMRAKYVICLMFKSNGDLITGDSNGTIYVWHDGGNTISQAIKHAHDGPVFSLLMIRNHLVSGGRDGLILSWTWGKSFDQSGSMQLPKSEGGIRMLCNCKEFLFIGSTLNCILTCNIALTGAPLMGISSLHKKPMTQGHYDDVRALTTYPNNSQQGLFVTAGYDGIISMYDAHNHETVWKYNVKGINILCFDIHHAGKMLALGIRDASLCIVDIRGGHEVNELCKVKVSKERITCVKFSPDGTCLAVGCLDRVIYILRLENRGKKCETIGKCKGHASAISGIDWSVDKPFGNYILQSSGIDYEHAYWDGGSCEKIENPSEVRNVEWVSHNCRVGYPVIGVWGESSNGNQIHALDRSYNHKLLATVNDNKEIMLYNYPCCSPVAQGRSYKTNNIETRNVAFVYDNNYLITVGGKDTCIMQWKILSS